MPSGRALLTICLAAAAAAVAGGVYVLSIALSEDISFQEHHPAYWIVVTSDTVRGFPRFEADGESATFTYRARDGTAPGQITMAYVSKQPIEALEQKHRLFCTQVGYVHVEKNKLLLPTQLGCDAADYRIEIDFRPRADSVLVTVMFLEN